MKLLLDCLLDALLDCAKVLPFLFLTYLFIEYLEHRASEKLEHALAHLGRFGIPVGALLGLIPQCGFSVAAANLYTGGIITAGTLAAVFVASSDEALPVLLTSGADRKYLLWLLGIKLAAALLAGLLAELVFRGRDERENPEEAHAALHSHCSHGCEHHGSILKSALYHALEVALFVFLVLFVFGLLVELVGEAAIASLFGLSPVLAPILAALVGFIPSCASSVILAELFAAGVLPFGALCAGLVTNTGIALTVLFRSEKLNRRFPLLMAGFLFLTAVATGLLVTALVP